MDKNIIILNGTVSAVLSTIFGIDNILAIETVIIFFTLNLISGVMKGIKNKSLSSDEFLLGIFKLVSLFFIILIARRIDMFFPESFGNKISLVSLVCYFYVGHLGISVLENSSEIGLPIPKKLKNVLKQLQEEKTKE